MSNSRSLAVLNKAARNSSSMAQAATLAKSSIPLNKPQGGWRNPTIRDLEIIGVISARPGLTPTEIADVAQVYTFQVNECLLLTRQGRLLAENGSIALPFQGRRPRWADLVRNQDGLVSKTRSYQGGPKLSLTGGIPADIRSNSRTLDDSIRAFVSVVSPRKRAAIKADINDIVHTQALGASEQRKQIAGLTADLSAAHAKLSASGDRQMIAVATALKDVIASLATENENKVIAA